MKYFLLLLALVSSAIHAQLESDKTFFDFGDITEDSSRTVDFFIINKYSKRVSPSVKGFDLDLSTRQYPYSLQPDSTMTLRIKMNRDELGPIEKKVIVSCWDCQDSLILTLKANILSFDYEKNGPAEEIDRPREPNEEEKQFLPVEFKVIDKKTKQPIPDIDISFMQIYPPYQRTKTDAEGKMTRNFQLGYSYSIFKYGYNYHSGKIYLGCNDSVRIIELEPYETFSANHFSNANFHFPTNRVSPEEAEEKMNQIFRDMQDSVVLDPLDTAFKSNNIVFLMDISFSMIEEGRMDLLQTSLVNMIKVLRPEDRVSIITFASETKVLFEPMVATEENKVKMIRMVKGLRPGGLTNGGKGLKTAYKFIDQNALDDGNNQLIVCTDGGLNDYMRHNALLSLVEKNSDHTLTSILMIHGYSYAYSYMNEIATSGKGHLLPINSEKASKEILIKEIKLNSRK